MSRFFCPFVYFVPFVVQFRAVKSAEFFSNE
jgi:hypothetical protein